MSVFKNLFESDLLDMAVYDQVVNVDRLSLEAAGLGDTVPRQPQGPGRIAIGVAALQPRPTFPFPFY